jgi:uncharacterized protein involved in type VI secretion and phage assembly
MIDLDPKGPATMAERERMLGLYPAIVTAVTDSDRQGRVEVELPWLPAEDGRSSRVWARLATLMTGNNRGTWFIPEVGDEVLLGFMAGDPRWPIVVGSLWNGSDAPPETMDDTGGNHIRSITSRSGHKIILDDTPGAERVEITTPAQRKLTLDDGRASVELSDAEGNRVHLAAGGQVTVEGLTTVTVRGAAAVKVEAGMVDIQAGLSKFSGVVQCDTLITNAVVSASYTPGAGNVW